ncbi:hypothetical protein GE21DRAFT_1059412 [Neurospora crassa]|nr:hypothetical protein GE21DRAFT_1059412 [Neurospora crassa]
MALGSTPCLCVRASRFRNEVSHFRSATACPYISKANTPSPEEICHTNGDLLGLDLKDSRRWLYRLSLDIDSVPCSARPFEFEMSHRSGMCWTWLREHGSGNITIRLLRQEPSLTSLSEDRRLRFQGRVQQMSDALTIGLVDLYYPGRDFGYDIVWPQATRRIPRSNSSKSDPALGTTLSNHRTI